MPSEEEEHTSKQEDPVFVLPNGQMFPGNVYYQPLPYATVNSINGENESFLPEKNEGCKRKWWNKFGKRWDGCNKDDGRPLGSLSNFAVGVLLGTFAPFLSLLGVYGFETKKLTRTGVLFGHANFFLLLLVCLGIFVMHPPHGYHNNHCRGRHCFTGNFTHDNLSNSTHPTHLQKPSDHAEQPRHEGQPSGHEGKPSGREGQPKGHGESKSHEGRPKGQHGGKGKGHEGPKGHEGQGRGGDSSEDSDSDERHGNKLNHKNETKEGDEKKKGEENEHQREGEDHHRRYGGHHKRGRRCRKFLKAAFAVSAVGSVIFLGLAIRSFRKFMQIYRTRENKSELDVVKVVSEPGQCRHFVVGSLISLFFPVVGTAIVLCVGRRNLSHRYGALYGLGIFFIFTGVMLAMHGIPPVLLLKGLLLCQLSSVHFKRAIASAQSVNIPL